MNPIGAINPIVITPEGFIVSNFNEFIIDGKNTSIFLFGVLYILISLYLCLVLQTPITASDYVKAAQTAMLDTFLTKQHRKHIFYMTVHVIYY